MIKTTSKLKLIFILIQMIPVIALAEDFIVTGEYQGKNVYIQNPLSNDNINFCTEYVYLNDQVVISFPKTSAFEIKLEHLHLGDPLVIRVIHKKDCKPKIINPQVIRSKSKFHFLSINANENEINWMTTGEYSNGIFYVEKYSGNEWLEDKTVYGRGNIDNNQYSISPNYFAGENKIRIKYTTEHGNIFYSKVFEHYSAQDPISFYPVSVSDKIFLSRKTAYQVLDPAGNLVAKGNSEVIDCSKLKTGLYYLSIENRQEKFFKK